MTYVVIKKKRKGDEGESIMGRWRKRLGRRVYKPTDPKTATHHEEQREKPGTESPSGSPDGANPANTLTLDFPALLH